MTLVEVMIACVVITTGVLAALGTLATSTNLDAELAERSTALRAASTKMEAVLAYDYGTSIQNLATYWALPANATFTVDRLPASADDDGTTVPQGAVNVDATDPDRVAVTVTITWPARRGTRTLSLPAFLTEVVP